MTSTGFNGMWLPEDQDPREQESPDGELATYRGYLRDYRLTLRLKCDGLDPEQLARRSVPPSTLSLLGLVRHMAAVEHFWFQRVLQGRHDQERMFRSQEDRDLDFNGAIGTQGCVDEAFAALDEQVALADDWLDRLDQASLGGRSLIVPDGQETATVRDVLVHMVEEYARHCGHADLLRECIDGRTGQ
jgi:uncharacterized damage-inducible protein DinB